MMENNLMICEQWSSNEKGRFADSLAEMLALTKAKIDGAADVYAVLDYAVAFGRYEHDVIEVALNKRDASGHVYQLQPLPLAYVREIRIFRNDRELRFVRSGADFYWRLRRDFDEEVPNVPMLHVLDEVHKLWGAVAEPSVRKEHTAPQNWSLLTAQRGSAFWVPGAYAKKAKVGLRIRNYITFAKADEGKGIVHFSDERLMGFAPWPGEMAKGGIGDEATGKQ